MESDNNIKLAKKECLRLLTRRDHSRKEIEQKLAVKGFELKLVTAVLDELAAKKWQDDSRFAENYARSRRQKGYGPVRIAHELKQKGIEQAQIKEQTQSGSHYWMEQIAAVCLKKYAKPDIMSREERAKCFRFLLQRGFSSEMINAFFKLSSHQST